jgi:5-methylcytosine-specific restriction protein B
LDPDKFSGKKLSVRLQIERVLPTAISRETIRRDPAFANLSILRAPQGTNFAVTPEQAEALDQLIEGAETGIEKLPTQAGYSLEDFARESRFEVLDIKNWRDRLKRKKHIVLQGPPGTGKTFVAERLARAIVSETQGFVETVQFHPSYAYEDFMEGIRPEVVEGQLTFNIRSGRFLDFCKEAARRGDAPCVMLIDEVNRGNLSRVFGELMYLLEYRDKSIPLSASGRDFHVPQNVFIIGTMNTADRSIALVDHALRRRFSFIYLGPNYDVLEAHLSEHDLPVKNLIQALQQVNSAINDRNYEIGISFFLADGARIKQNLPVIWEGEIEPYLEEYFYDQPDKVDELRWRKLSRTVLKDWAE